MLSKCFYWDRERKWEIGELWKAFLLSTEKETVSFYRTQGLGSHWCLHVSFWGTNPVIIDQCLKEIPLSRATHELLLSLEQFLHLFIQLLHLPLVSQLYFSWAISDMKLAMQNQSFLFYSPASEDYIFINFVMSLTYCPNKNVISHSETKEFFLSTFDLSILTLVYS